MNNPEYLEQLLKHGANPNLTVGNGAYTAIFSAILYDQVKNIPILIRYGADINWKMSDGETPFLYAVLCSAYEAALVLYNDGANPLIKSNDGYSAIDIIKKFGGNGAISSADKIANKQLLDELRAKGLLNN
jgi:ankyrin repeat protein